jgi:hypothetical protein
MWQAGRGTTNGGGTALLLIAIAMLVILVISGLVVAYVAFPHRGQNMPHAPWLGDAMNKATDAMPTLDEDEGTDGKA